MDEQREKRSSGSWNLLGCGVGLRQEHYTHVTNHWPQMDWFEVVTENYLDTGGRPLKILERIRERYPVAFHGVALSIGSVDPLNQNYLKRLKSLAERIQPETVSDHLCWSGVKNENLHDLLPLPFTKEAVTHIADRVDEVQNYLGRKILLENVSSYVTYKHSVMPEWEFLRAVAEQSGCGILLDINNLYVNSKNHGFDPEDYLSGLPAKLIAQFHLGGHTDMGDFLFDTHSTEVIEPVWKLYKKALMLYGPVSTLIEWDAAVPEFDRLSLEASCARNIYNSAKGTTLIERKIKPSIKIETSPQFSPPLEQVQSWFKAKIVPETQLNGSNELSEFLNPQGNASGIERSSIYAEGYLARNQESLSEVYEAVKHLLGENAFHHLAHDYAIFYRSTSYNLSLRGQGFPDFLKTHPVAKDFPFLPDLAQLEWLAAKAFHAYEKPFLNSKDLSQLAEEDWSDARFIFQDYVFVFCSDYPVADLWQAKSTPVKKIRINLVDRAQNVIIGRRGTTVFCHAIDADQYGFLKTLLEGKSLGQACENFDDDESVPAVTQWLSEWMQHSLLSGIQRPKFLTSSFI